MGPAATALDAHSIGHAFGEQVRWQSPNPPGTHFNIDRRTRVEVVDDHTVRLHPPAVDGLALGKLRATHVMSERSWRDLGFGYSRHGSGGRGRVRKAVPAGPLARRLHAVRTTSDPME